MSRVRLAGLCASAVLVPAVLSAQVSFERTGYRLTSIGERLRLSARVDNSRRQASPGARIVWHIADTTIAAVTADGTVISKRPGYTRIWAVSGKDSSWALILVDQWAAKFEFSPPVVRFDAVGSRQPLRMVVRDAAGHVIPERDRKSTTCRSLNDRVASLASTGEVTARTNGVTYVRCSDRGVADSVRIEVRQRAVRAVIAEKVNLSTKTVGDTFQIRLSALDRVGDEIRDVQPTWASMNPTVISVDPLSGKARSVGPGLAKVIAQVGDATDTVSITVNPGFGMPMPAASDTASGLEAPRVPTLAMQPLYLMVGDTGRVAATAKDAQGNVIPNPMLTFRAADTTVVSAVNTRLGQGWVARKTGVTFLVAQFGSIIDSMQVSVRAKGMAAATLASSTTNLAFDRPRWDTLTIRRQYTQRLDSAARAIKRASIVKEVTGRSLAVYGIAGQVAHSAHLTSKYTEKRSGLLYGGAAQLAPFSWLKTTGHFRTGTLSTGQTTGEDMTFSEVEANVTFFAAPWFGFGGGYVRRVEKTELASQRWDFPRVTAESQLPFVGGKLTSVTRVSLLPGAPYTGYTDSTGVLIKPSQFSLSGEAGLEVNTGYLSAAVMYYVESFSFPAFAGEKRRDQFSMLKLRVGLQLGR